MLYLTSFSIHIKRYVKITEKRLILLQDEKYRVLKDNFGHNNFRVLQEDGVDAILNNQDLLMILPTGGGKSLVYQLPTLLKKGVSVVISPLIALMQDQVAALKAQNISADMISSAQSKQEVDQVIAKLLDRDLKFLYLSPERLNTPQTRDLLRCVDINFFVIDEAHCISQWGHEFRDDYRALSQLKQHFPDTNICAFTATSTDHVTSDIINNLNLDNPLMLKGKIFRKNIFISAQRRLSNGYKQLENFLSRHEDESGIIYVSSRKKAETLSEYLNDNDYKSLAYHAGLPQGVREQNFKDFVNDKVDIMVATIAFGMGIDKSDIRFVVHTSLPKSTENYYQEIGRAGRDGEDCEVLLLFNASDIAQHKRFLEEVPASEFKDHMTQKIEKIYTYATSEICFHKQLASYFDDKIDDCKDRCDNCLDIGVKREDITKEAQMILSCIYKTNQSFGKNYVIDILRGSKEQKLLANGADKLSVYSIGTHISKKVWFIILERLLELNLLSIGEYSVLKLSQESVDVLKGKKTIDIKASRLEVNVKEKKVKQSEDFDYDEDLFEQLRAKRRELALELDVPAYIIFGDKTLKHLAKDKPYDKNSMLMVNGVGEKKFEQFGDDFLNIINN